MKINIPKELTQVGNFVRGVEKDNEGYLFFLESVRESDNFESIFNKKSLESSVDYPISEFGKCNFRDFDGLLLANSDVLVKRISPNVFSFSAQVNVGSDSCSELDACNLAVGIKYPVLPKNDSLKIVRFVELRGHSDYSMGSSTARIKEIVSKSEVGAGLTDPNVGFGLYDFNQEMISAGKKAINGVELSLLTISGRISTISILAKNIKGYRVLCKILTQSSVLKEKGKTMSLSDLLQFDGKDLIILSDSKNGIVVPGYTSEQTLKDIFSFVGEDDFYLEVQLQDDNSDDLNERISTFAKKKNIGVVLTNDYRQSDNSQNEALRVVQALNQKKLIEDAELISGDNHYFHQSEEVESWGVPSDWLDKTIEIFNKVEQYNLEVKDNYSPVFDIPKGFSGEKDYFWHLANQGLKRRFKGKEIPKEYIDRLNFELDIIDSMGFNGYFLIVADFINYGKRNFEFYDDETVKRWKNFIHKKGYSPNAINFGPARGSCAGSLVAYSMAITEIDPMKYGLLFERFLNPERVSMPDIDTDIPDTHRKEIIEYTKDYYNVSDNPVDSRVAGIAAFGTYQLKNTLKAIPRAYYSGSTSVSLGNKMVKLVRDPGMGMSDYLNSPEVIALREEDSRVDRVLSVAPQIYGMISNLTQHAAGYVIAPDAVTEFLPTVFVAGEQLTAYTHVEDNGLLKMDFLGLKAVTIIQSTLDKIKQDTGISITSTDIIEKATTDINVFRTIASGKTKNLFQLGSPGMTEVITKSMADISEPDAEEKALSGDYFSRIIAGISMYRPGPMSFIPKFIENALHPDDIEYVVPEMKDILSTSYGLLIYQESIMSLLQVVGGFTLGGADLARRAIGKKKFEILQSLKETFIYGDEKNGIPGGIKKTGRSVEELEKMWSDIEAFAAYGFNKSHAAGYSLIAVTEAWLFTYYPEYFAAEDLNKVGGNQKVTERENLHEMLQFYNRCGIEILPVDINVSEDGFRAKNGKVYFGLNKVSKVATSAGRIFKERQQGGDFKSFYDFLSRMSRNTSGINKGVLQSLILSGGFDSFSGTRKDKIAKLPEISEMCKILKKEKEILFDKFDDSYFEDFLDYSGEELDFQELLAEEKKVTSFYISGHPTDEYIDAAKRNENFKNISELDDLERGEYCYLVGVVNSVRQITTKTGNLMAFASVEDATGTVDIVVFSDTYKMYGRYLEPGNVLNITAEKTVSDRGTSYVVRSLRTAGQLNIVTDVDHIQIILSGNNSGASEVLNKILNEAKNPDHEFSPRMPLSYVFGSKEFFKTKNISELKIPLDLKMINYVKHLIGGDSIRMIWNSEFEDDLKEISVDELIENGEFELQI